MNNKQDFQDCCGQQPKITTKYSKDKKRVLLTIQCQKCGVWFQARGDVEKVIELAKLNWNVGKKYKIPAVIQGKA